MQAWDSLIKKYATLTGKFDQREQCQRRISSLYTMLSDIYGADRLVLRAGKMGIIEMMRSEDMRQNVLGLQKLVLDDPTLDQLPAHHQIPAVLEQLEEEMAELLARRATEDRLEKKIASRMQERHEEYIKEIRMQVLSEEANSAENPATLKKFAKLQVMEQQKLAQSLMEVLRPVHLDDIVGQERAVQAIRAKLASPYPQHLIFYGPPGVGKTTAARLILEEAKKLTYTPFERTAPFVEVDGTTLRWDPRDMTNPLMGSVHDPIYQGARRDLADSGVPEPKLGLVSEAHGGILFIDEIGEMDALLQNKLLKVLEDKRAHFDSAYYDPSDSRVPQYIKKLFDEGAPADFVLIGATTRECNELNPAIRSRCAEVYFEPLTPDHIRQIVRRAASRLDVVISSQVEQMISEYTIEGRKAVSLVADAYGVARYRSPNADQVTIEEQDILQVAQISRLSPYVTTKASTRSEVGAVFGLGVAGYLGSVLEIEAVAYPCKEKGKGSIRFNDTAGSMARDSVFNAAAVVRKLTGKQLDDYDLHINVIGGGRIDGPSAGAAITVAIISSILDKPVRQDVAISGEISLHGRIKPVGGVFEKAYGAKQAGIEILIVPQENRQDIPDNMLGLDVRFVEQIEEIMDILFNQPETVEQVS